MKTIYMMTAAVAALAVAAPASAQRWNNNQTPSRELATQIEHGARTGAITPREIAPLRNSLRNLVRLERTFASNGISRREQIMLEQRSASLRRQIDLAGQSGFGRNRPGDRDFRDDRFASNVRFDGPNRGDRFTGDVRVGQRLSARMIAVPDQYRGEFRDDADVYFRYDDGRIYQVDRKTNLILRLTDLDWTERHDRRDSASRSGRFDGPNRGDRFAGDARVGHRLSARMIAVPDQYRGEYRDDGEVYYRYDDGRVFQVDRRTNLILGLSDMDWTDRDDRRDTSSRRRFGGTDRGDRFAGDARIGGRMSARMVALPEQYRGEYRDDADVYYRYDDGRIYQVDRRTNLILGLSDMDWTDRDDRRDSATRSRWFDRPNRGDRFAGDARVGHRLSARMIAVPEHYRGAYRDDGDVYYRYDDGRIYQVDRRTNLISGLLDLLN